MEITDEEEKKILQEKEQKNQQGYLHLVNNIISEHS